MTRCEKSGNLQVRCASCEGQATIPVARQGKWTYLKCVSCGSLELSPVPTETELCEYYNSVYSVPLASYRQNYERISGSLLKSIGAKAHRGKLLEIGCSHGAFLLEARKLGWDVTGIEISESAVQNARMHSLNVIAGTLEQSDNLLGVFDCVVAWHVIEHIADVANFVATVKKHLTPGGLLALRTPNADSLVARTIPQYWQWIGAPAHIRLFSVAGMRQLLQRHGFSGFSQGTRRGDARTFGTDLLMAVAKAVVGRGSQNADGLSAQKNGSRGGKLAPYTDLVFKPGDWILGIDGRNMLGAELFVMASNQA
jgi:SAM-dependent methyltransferase